MSARTSSGRPVVFSLPLIFALLTGCNESTDPGLGLTIEVTPEATTIEPGPGDFDGRPRAC